jgi:2-dehydropantoate 2-reductase
MYRGDETAEQAAVTKPAMANLRVLVLGADGIGGYFRGRMAESGADVRFLVREGRRKSLVEDGLWIESPFGNATLAVKTVISAPVKPN